MFMYVGRVSHPQENISLYLIRLENISLYLIRLENISLYLIRLENISLYLIARDIHYNERYVYNLICLKIAIVYVYYLYTYV